MLGGGYSTYFVLISSDFYNPFSKVNQEHLKKIIKSGHEIGLHFDEKKYMDEETFDRDYLCTCAEKELKILSEMIGKPVTCISMHRPSKRFLESDFSLDGVVNSYSNLFFQEFKYLSDSRMHWRENAEEVIVSQKPQALHILTHPIWYGKEERTMHDIMKDFVGAARPERYRNLADNIRNFQEILAPEEAV